MEGCSNSSFGHGVGSGVPGVTRSPTSAPCGSSSAVTFGSHGSTFGVALGPVGDVPRVVLVGQRREVVAELVNEDVLGVGAVDRRGRLIVEDAAAAVGPLVDEDLDELVGRRRGSLAQGAVVEREHVARSESKTLYSADRGVRWKTPAFEQGAPRPERDVDGADVEIAAPAAERFLREERADQPLDVGVELRHLGRRVTLAQHQEIDLPLRWTAVDDAPHGVPRCDRRSRRGIDEPRRGSIS